MQYAIIQLAGKQFKVKAGDILTTDRLVGSQGDEFTISDVLLVGDDEKNSVSVGTPMVKGASVTLKLSDHTKGDKIRVAKYKNKSRYRRVYGHRQHLTSFEVVSISA